MTIRSSSVGYIIIMMIFTKLRSIEKCDTFAQTCIGNAKNKDWNARGHA